MFESEITDLSAINEHRSERTMHNRKEKQFLAQCSLDGFSTAGYSSWSI
jgi:hypothetical protein